MRVTHLDSGAAVGLGLGIGSAAVASPEYKNPRVKTFPGIFASKALVPRQQLAEGAFMYDIHKL